MRALLSSAWVIARRDFSATVFSRSFILFLLGPLIAVAFGGLIGRTADSSDNAAMRPVLTVLAAPDAASAIEAAYRRIETRIEPGRLPILRFVRPISDPEAQAKAIAREDAAPGSVVLSHVGQAPRLTGAPNAIAAMRGTVGLILDGMALSNRPAARIGETEVAAPRVGSEAGQKLVGRGAQTLVFMLTVLLAGMLLSNLVEEKSNKVIEVLASAVPVDAIFMGKLIAMLGVSMTGIVMWGGLIGGALFAFLPSSAALPPPAIGWPMFALLLPAYYVMNYMIVGGIFLGIGAQAASVREVQTLSMPLTMAQLATFALGSAAINHLDGSLARFAMLFPLSSPLTMVGRAAQDGTVWPHAAALAWQALWVALIVKFAASRFRTGVLKSGPSPSRARRWKSGRAAH